MAIGAWLCNLFGQTGTSAGKNVLVYAGPDQPDPLVHGIRSVGSPEERGAALRWIEAAESPFGERVLDCRSITRGSISSVRTAEELEAYVALRSDSGVAFRGQHLTGRVAPCALQYELTGSWNGASGRLFTSSRLEYKWDVALWDALFFSRSWTGDLVYRADFEISDHSLFIRRIEASPSVEAPGANAAFDVAAVDFLVRVCLLNEQPAHPIPRALAELSKNEIALWSMKYFGCQARFGKVVSE